MSFIFFCIIHWKYISFPVLGKNVRKMLKCNRETAQSSEKKKKQTQKAILFFYYILSVSLFIFYMISLIIRCIPEIIFQLQGQLDG